MIKFNWVEYKNIMSIGNTPIRIQLDRSPTTVIGGHNGSGKTSLLIAVVYCLYNKVLTGLKLDQVINSTNKKNLLTKVEFERYGETWQVVRGEKPKKFEIYRDGELIDQYANARDQQAFLEMILGMDYKLFVQMVVINKERYVPFMEMNAGDRRKIVEDILDISVFSYMNDALKVKIADNDKALANLLRDAQLKSTEMKGKQELISQIKAAIAESDVALKEQIAEKEDQIKKLNAKAIELDEQYHSLSLEGYDKVKKNISELNNLSVEFETDIKRLEKDKKFFVDNDNCPTCGQSIDDLKHEHIAEFDSKIEAIQDAAGQMVETLEHLISEQKRFKEIEDKKTLISSEQQSVIREITLLQREVDSMKAKPKSTGNEERLRKAVAEYDALEASLKELRDQVSEKEKQKALYDEMRVYLKDDGIKAHIVREYNAILNKKINEYLNAMGFYVNMTIDENFKETFHSMNRQGFVYENLSSGQKCRVSIAITLALLEIGAIKNSAATNLLCMDETMEPVDAEGVKDVMNLFRTKLAHKNIFVVTQRFQEFSDLFQSQIQFKLNQGFTEIVN